MNSTKQFARAASRFQQRDLRGAQTLAQAILAVTPGYVDANCLLGMIAARDGHADTACQLIKRAIQSRPDQQLYYITNWGWHCSKAGAWKRRCQPTQRRSGCIPALQKRTWAGAFAP